MKLYGISFCSPSERCPVVCLVQGAGLSCQFWMKGQGLLSALSIDWVNGTDAVLIGQFFCTRLSCLYPKEDCIHCVHLDREVGFMRFEHRCQASPTFDELD